MYIYIYIERERERERVQDVQGYGFSCLAARREVYKIILN